MRRCSSLCALQPVQIDTDSLKYHRLILLLLDPIPCPSIVLNHDHPRGVRPTQGLSIDPDEYRDDTDHQCSESQPHKCHERLVRRPWLGG